MQAGQSFIKTGTHHGIPANKAIQWTPPAPLIFDVGHSKKGKTVAIDNEKASTQYGDIKGTISIDGFEGPILEKLRSRSNMPKGYVAVGFAINSYARQRKSGVSHSVSITVYGADSDQMGIGPDGWREYLKNNNEVSVFAFDAEISIDELLEMMKIITIKGWHKVISSASVRILEDG